MPLPLWCSWRIVSVHNARTVKWCQIAAPTYCQWQATDSTDVAMISDISSMLRSCPCGTNLCKICKTYRWVSYNGQAGEYNTIFYYSYLRTINARHQFHSTLVAAFSKHTFCHCLWQPLSASEHYTMLSFVTLLHNYQISVDTSQHISFMQNCHAGMSFMFAVIERLPNLGENTCILFAIPSWFYLVIVFF